MKSSYRRRTLMVVTTITFSLLFAQFPNTSVNAATICQGPAAYPPDLPDCLDPVVLAKQEADRKAAEQKAAAEAAALKAAQEKAEQESNRSSSGCCKR